MMMMPLCHYGHSSQYSNYKPQCLHSVHMTNHQCLPHIIIIIQSKTFIKLTPETTTLTDEEGLMSLITPLLNPTTSSSKLSPYNFPTTPTTPHSLSLVMPFPLLLLLLSLPLSHSPASPPPPPAPDLLLSSCVHTRYPHLCLRTLSPYSHPSITPNDLAQAALNVSLDHARHISRFLHSHHLPSSSKPSHRRRQSALHDCAEQISDSVDQLSRSLMELKHLRQSTFRLQMSNAQTWVSAAMTNDDTCLEGLSPVHDRVVWKIKRKIKRVARVTSNALYMINRLCDSRPMQKSEPSD